SNLGHKFSSQGHMSQPYGADFGIESSSLDPANLVQFLATGRFFAGETALTDVRSLLPGEILVERAGRLRSRRHFRYRPAADAARDPRDVCAELDTRIERSILEAWESARRPALMLSGGYDSRFLLCTVARAVGDPSTLRTISWGASPERPCSDAEVALRIADDLGTRHRHWRPWVAASTRDVERLFFAQSGMTDCTFTHVEELANHAELGRDEGIDAVLRGDEIFGPLAPEVRSIDDALSVLGLCRCASPSLAASFVEDGDAMLAAHAERCERGLDHLPEEPSALRDALYVRERSPSFLQHLNYHRGHDLEVLNPLVDLDILRLWGELPAEQRLGKRAFRTIFEQRFGRHLEKHPIATCGNGLDWAQELRDRPALTASIRADLDALPAPLSATWALATLDAVLAGEPVPDDGPPPVRSVFRAWVLGRWVSTWAA
ncbi:MAG: asparagine synthase-related protein, partial [Acidobacteriota bacterium]